MDKYAQAIVNSLQEALVVVDQDLRVLAVNEPFTRLVGLSAPEVEGRDIHELLPDRSGIPELQDLLEAVPGGNSEELVIEHDFGKAGRRAVLIDVRAVEETGHMLLLIKDVTARKRAEDQIRDMAARVTMAKHRERHRIATLLHEDIQQRLYAMGLRLAAASTEARVGQTDRALENLSEIEQWLSECRELVRSTAADLSPPILADEGLPEALDWLAGQMQSRYDLHVELTSEQPAPQITDEMRILLHRCVRELLFNVVKHAGTTSASVHVRLRSENVEIEVADEGSGFDPAATAAGQRGESLGLFEMREELGHFGGAIEIDSAPGRGTRVTLRVPIHCDLL